MKYRAFGLALLCGAPAESATLIHSFQHDIAIGSVGSRHFLVTDLIPKFDVRLGSLSRVILESTASYRVALNWEISGADRDYYASYGSFRALVHGAASDDYGYTAFLVGNQYYDEMLGVGALKNGSGNEVLKQTYSREYTTDQGLSAATGNGTFTSTMDGEFWHFYEVVSGTGQGRASQTGLLTIAGRYIFQYNAVPEPATWVAMVTGFGLAGFAFRSRAKKVSLLTA